MQKVEHIGLKPVGEPGPTLLISGRWDSNKAYTRDSEVMPLVEHEGLFYSLNKIGTTQGGLNPKDDYAKNGSKATWKLQNSYEMVIVKAIVADGGLLGDFVFWGGKMFSKQGVDGQGNFSDKYTEYPKGNFIPNYTVDAVTGEIIALEGQFGLLHIQNSELIGKSADGNEVMRITANKVPDASVFKGEWVLVSTNTDIFNDSFFFDNTYIPSEVTYRGDWSIDIKCDKVGQYRLDNIYTTYQPSLTSPEIIGYIVNTITVRDPRGSIVKREAIRDGDVVFYANTPGTYSVTCDVFIEFTPRFGGKDVAMTIGIDSSFQGVLYKSTPSNTTLIGSDGLYTSFSSEEFLHYKANEGFILRSGNYGLRVSKSGIQKWNGSQWVTANI